MKLQNLWSGFTKAIIPMIMGLFVLVDPSASWGGISATKLEPAPELKSESDQVDSKVNPELDDQAVAPDPHRFRLVEYYTAETLRGGEWKIGLDLDFATSSEVMIGTDLQALFGGAPTVQMKVKVYQEDEQAVALGLAAAYFDQDTALWGSHSDYFESLEAKFVRPYLAWTNKLSGQLNLHTYWSVGVGKTKVRLSEKGQRRLWESKNPEADWATRDAESANNSKKVPPGSISNRLLLLQTLTGMHKDVFQITGEFIRETGRKILITSRVENMEIEQLKSNSMRFSISQQWIFDHFQFRLGVGLLYQVLSGVDLDGSQVDDTSILPVPDIDFYWRF